MNRTIYFYRYKVQNKCFYINSVKICTNYVYIKVYIDYR